jgi:hypothetical protein
MSRALLLAEPQADTRGFLERHLTNDGFQVVGAEARPDLVQRIPVDGANPDIDTKGDLATLNRRSPPDVS